MRNAVLSLALLPFATPALAHLDEAPHVHGSDGVLWGLAIVAAALVGVRLLRGRD